MAIIHDKSLFSWENLENCKDLERLDFLLDHLPDEELMLALEKARGNGRDDYPIRATWNSLLSGIVFEHKSTASLRRELKRNASLRQRCGFDPILEDTAVPSQSAYTNIFKSLVKHQHLVSDIFEKLVKLISGQLPDFGRVTAVDGKTIQSLAKSETNKPSGDNRRDTDARWSVKTYSSKDGKTTKKVSIFGYTLHLLVDAKYELPIQRKVTPGNVDEKALAAELIEICSDKMQDTIEYCIADKGYDSGPLKLGLLRKHDIKAIMDTRNLTKSEYSVAGDNYRVLYNQQGEVFCRCGQSFELNKMAYVGYEEKRETIKYRCPAIHYGIDCPSLKSCIIGNSIRIPLKLNPRIFTAVPMDSLKWKNLYKKRTSVERTFSRLDVSFGFENHYIRGLKKMQLRVDLALIIMLGIAHGSIKEGRHKKMRSLVNCVA